AKIVLPRRQELDRAKEELDDAREEMMQYEYEEQPDAVVAREADAEEKFTRIADAYALVLGYLGDTYPILPALGDPDRSVEALEDLTKQKAGPGMAAMLGKEIVKRLSNIAKVRTGLDDPDKVNIWRLPMLVGLTRAQMDIDSDPFEKRIIDER